MYDPNSQAFYHNFVWYLQTEDALALQERDNQLARAVRDTYADLLPVSHTSESQVRDFNAACAAYREGEEKTVQMSTVNS